MAAHAQMGHPIANLMFALFYGGSLKTLCNKKNPENARGRRDAFCRFGCMCFATLLLSFCVLLISITVYKAILKHLIMHIIFGYLFRMKSN